MPAEIGRIALTQLVSGALVRLEHPPFHVLVTRVGERIYALEDACPHSGLSLCRGSLNGYVITCAGHAWDIDVRTGHVLKPTGIHERNPCFEVTVEGDHAVIWTP